MSEHKRRGRHARHSAAGRPPSELGARNRALAHQPRHRRGAVDQRRWRDVAEHAAVEHQQLAALALPRRTPRAIRSAPGAGGCPGRLAEVEVSGLPSGGDQPRDAGVRRVTHRDAALAARAAASGSCPSPPGSTRVSGPGQNASASARAAAVKHQAPLLRHRPARRPAAETACRGGAALEPRERSERRHRGRRSRVRRRFRWDRRADRRARDARRRRESPPRSRRRCGTAGSCGRGRARHSARARSSRVVILRLRGSSGTSRTAASARFHQGGVVGGVDRRAARSAYARSSSRAGKALRRLRAPEPVARHGAHATRGRVRRVRFLERVAHGHRRDRALARPRAAR